MIGVVRFWGTHKRHPYGKQFAWNREIRVIRVKNNVPHRLINSRSQEPKNLKTQELKNYDTTLPKPRMATIGKVPLAIIGQRRQLGHRICLFRTGKHVDKV